MTTNPLQAEPTFISGTVQVSGTIPVSIQGTATITGSVQASIVGTALVSVVNLPATQTVAGTVSVTGTVSVAGTATVAVTNFPATQNVAGTVGISGTVPITAPTISYSFQSFAGTATIKAAAGTLFGLILTGEAGTTAVAGTLTVLNGAATIAVIAVPSAQTQPVGFSTGIVFSTSLVVVASGSVSVTFLYL
jgi:hypothetical protein